MVTVLSDWLFLFGCRVYEFPMVFWEENDIGIAEILFSLRFAYLFNFYNVLVSGYTRAFRH